MIPISNSSKKIFWLVNSFRENLFVDGWYIRMFGIAWLSSGTGNQIPSPSTHWKGLGGYYWLRRPNSDLSQTDTHEHWPLVLKPRSCYVRSFSLEYDGNLDLNSKQGCNSKSREMHFNERRDLALFACRLIWLTSFLIFYVELMTLCHHETENWST